MEEVGFGLTGMVGNGGSRFWPDWNGWKWRKVFGITRMIWNGGNRFWPDWNAFEWGKLFFGQQKWFEKKYVPLGRRLHKRFLV
jgi:hypothetical protein